MSEPAAFSPNLSLAALRGAVGDVVGVADEVGCWDRLVSIWRIFWALDALIAVLWAIVHRLRAGELVLGGECPAEAVSVERGMVARFRPLRVRAVAGARAVASVGRVRVRVGVRVRVAWGRRGRELAWRAPVLGVRGRRFSELAVGASRIRVLIVPA